ncbi:MAG TPA: biotin/lipoyl-containing protein [Gaiellaceae bacterium]|nr:biotin/lipoyl-containing protein [Gaiellaceae bacterium]
MLEIVLTREDANTEYALLAEWLVEDRAEVAQGQPVCVVETTKATVEVETPGSGTIVQLYEEGVEVELGKTIAYVAESADELRRIDEGRAEERPAEPKPAVADRKATRKAVELAERHEVDLSAIEKQGFITERDVEELVAARTAEASPEARPLLAGIPLDGVTLPASFDLDESAGRLEPAFLDSIRSDPSAFAALAPDEKVQTLREHGASVGEGVVLAEGSVIVAPQVVLEDGVRLGPGANVRCEEIVAIGELTQFGADLELLCRRAFVGRGIWAGRSVRFGGGGHRDPWAVLAVGDLAFVGDEAFVNVCRPVLIGREVFLTMRSMVVTHNIGHSILEGFENRFAPVVLEDRSQVGLGAVVYAGCRIGAEAIVASGSYVTSDIAPGSFAIGVPAKVTGKASHMPSRARQVELGRKMIDDLHELLAVRGHEVSAIADGEARGFEVEGTRVLFVPSFRGGVEAPAVVLALEASADPPEGVAVLDLLGRRVQGTDGLVLDSVREYCRKRGIRFEPGPWRYGGGLI